MKNNVWSRAFFFNVIQSKWWVKVLLTGWLVLGAFILTGCGNAVEQSNAATICVWDEAHWDQCVWAE